MDKEILERLPLWAQEIHKIQESIKNEKQRKVATDNNRGDNYEEKEQR
jgi:hypothetical protein